MSRKWTGLLINDPGDDQDYVEFYADTIEEAADQARAMFSRGWAEVTIFGDGDPLVISLDDPPTDTEGGGS
ncbi:hypothetical protein [Nocardia sp. NPDC049149]|uniref:hypothetical protein n=1 Tax=Nocardia sp. NPDC049149 TaxID=3364315 RepID=UPI00371202D4